MTLGMVSPVLICDKPE